VASASPPVNKTKEERLEQTENKSWRCGPLCGRLWGMDANPCHPGHSPTVNALWSEACGHVLTCEPWYARRKPAECLAVTIGRMNPTKRLAQMRRTNPVGRIGQTNPTGRRSQLAERTQCTSNQRKIVKLEPSRLGRTNPIFGGNARSDLLGHSLGQRTLSKIRGGHWPPWVRLSNPCVQTERKRSPLSEGFHPGMASATSRAEAVPLSGGRTGNPVREHSRNRSCPRNCERRAKA
jgi:hypothetical protein